MFLAIMAMIAAVACGSTDTVEVTRVVEVEKEVTVVEEREVEVTKIVTEQVEVEVTKIVTGGSRGGGHQDC